MKKFSTYIPCILLALLLFCPAARGGMLLDAIGGMWRVDVAETVALWPGLTKAQEKEGRQALAEAKMELLVAPVEKQIVLMRNEGAGKILFTVVSESGTGKLELRHPNGDIFLLEAVPLNGKDLLILSTEKDKDRLVFIRKEN